MFLNGWPNELKKDVRIEAIYKVHNDSLELRYQRFIDSNPKFVTENCIGWHGTSSNCHDGSCMSWTCHLCQIIRHGFKRHCARQDTISYKCWGPATYFASRSFVCHTYNGGSSCNTNKRCTIMTKINSGHTLDDGPIMDNHGSSYAPDHFPAVIKKFKYDSIALTRDYYIAPADYILLYNDLAALPMYIIVYSVRKPLQVRKESGQYCHFHGENHMVDAFCDGHQVQSLECVDRVCMDKDHNHFTEFKNL